MPNLIKPNLFSSFDEYPSGDYQLGQVPAVPSYPLTAPPFTQFHGIPLPSDAFRPGPPVQQRQSEPTYTRTPRLIRATQVFTTENCDSSSALLANVFVEFQDDIHSLTLNWTPEEVASGRRLVLMSWTQNFNILSVSFRTLASHEYITGQPVLSCLYCKELDRHFVTSVDIISMLEHLVRARFPVQEKNRTRRNLQSLKPLTISKSSPKLGKFFELIMEYDSPKPRHVEKDVKVLYWSCVGPALVKVLGKYVVDPNSRRPSVATPVYEPTAH